MFNRYLTPANASILPLGPKRGELDVYESFLAVFSMIVLMFPGDKLGLICSHWAIIPATVGAAIEVPVIAPHKLSPSRTTSGTVGDEESK